MLLTPRKVFDLRAAWQEKITVQTHQDGIFVVWFVGRSYCWNWNGRRTIFGERVQNKNVWKLLWAMIEMILLHAKKHVPVSLDCWRLQVCQRFLLGGTIWDCQVSLYSLLSKYHVFTSFWIFIFSVLIWFRFLKSPDERDCFLGVARFESQTTGPQTTNLPLVGLKPPTGPNPIPSMYIVY